MGVIIDTSIWVDVERGHLSPSDVAALTGDAPVYTAPPIIAELEYGVNKATDPAQKNKRASAMTRIKKKPCLIIDRDTGDIFGKIAAELDKIGLPATHRAQDLWIAALAIQHNMSVLTKNIRDFEEVPGVKLILMPGRT